MQTCQVSDYQLLSSSTTHLFVEFPEIPEYLISYPSENSNHLLVRSCSTGRVIKAYV